MSSELEISLRPIRSYPDIADTWSRLAERADCSVFQSWSWIGTWCDWLPSGVEPMLLLAERDGQPVAAAVLVHRVTRRQFVLRPRQWHLTETGDADLDRLHIEYNDLLIAADDKEHVMRRMVTWLLENGPEGDEIVFNRVTDGLAQIAQDVSRTMGRPTEVWQRTATYTISLETLDASADGYVERLSRNTRWQVRRALRLYETKGAVTFESAQSLEEAESWFDTMCAVHKFAWRRKKVDGAFAFPTFTGFHASLLSRFFENGVIDICKVTAGDQMIGILYNLVWRGRVLNYQSGFVYDDEDNRLKPGLVCHALAARHYAEKGLKEYDMLGGGGHYKARLAEPGRHLVSLSIGSNKPLYRAERLLRVLRPLKRVWSGSPKMRTQQG